MKKDFLKIEITNKKARFNYEFLETFKAGIALLGTEIKSIKQGKVNLSDSFCYFKNEELWLKNLHISEYSSASFTNHEPLRIRKLLLTKKELNKLKTKVKEKGLTIVPFSIFFNERGFAKVEIALAKGKKTFDKRETLKQRDSQKDIDRAKKSYR